MHPASIDKHVRQVCLDEWNVLFSGLVTWCQDTNPKAGIAQSV